MAIAYKSQGAGVATETSGAALQPACPATVDANDILVAHVVYLDNATAPVLPTGWTLLFPNPADISVGSGLGTGTPTGRAWAFGKIAAGTEDGAAISFGTQGGTVGRLARIYSFSGYVSGTITDVIPAASFTANSSETDPVIQAVTTTVAGAKAVSLVSQDDNNSHAGLGDVGNGTWVEAVADFVDTAVGAQGAKLQIQVGTPTSDPGTISGGTVAGTDDEANTLNFEIRPNAAAVPVEALPGTGVLDATGFAPTVQTPRTVTPGTGALSATGFSPTVVASNHQAVAPGTGELTVEGFAPTVNVGVNLTPGAGELAAAGFAPTVTVTAHQTVLVDVGVLTVTGFAPTVAVSNHQIVLTGFGEAQIIGFAPTVQTPVNVLAGVGVLEVEGYEPGVDDGSGITVGCGVLLFEGYAPDVVATTRPPRSRPIPAWLWERGAHPRRFRG